MRTQLLSLCLIATGLSAQAERLECIGHRIQEQEVGTRIEEIHPESQPVIEGRASIEHIVCQGEETETLIAELDAGKIVQGYSWENAAGELSQDFQTLPVSAPDVIVIPLRNKIYVYLQCWVSKS